MPRPRPTASLRRFPIIVLALCGIAGSSGFVAQQAVAADAATSFSTSFESGDPQPLVNSVAQDNGAPVQQNVRATGSNPGDFTKSATETTASANNPPNEVVAKLIDSDPSTKWLALTSTGWAQYHFAAPHTVTSYSLTSANDSQGRDPKNWTLQGSTDGTTWKTLDTESGVTFGGRLQRKSFDVDSAAPETYFRLNVTANSGDSYLQLADWNLVQAAPTGTPQPMVTSVGSGPANGYNIVSNVGFTGKKALLYSGEAVAKGEASETNTLYSGLSIPVEAGSQLSYRIFPEMTGGDLQYPSTYAAIDVHFTDGTTLSGLGAKDQHDFPLTAKGQGQSKVLYASQWNAVQSDLGAVAAGKTIDSILLRYDNPDATAKTAFQGWVDDLKVVASAPKIDGSSLTNYVDTRRGSNASGTFSRGANLPITAMPNGFNFYTPLTDSTSTSREYLYAASNDGNNLSTFQGLGVSHEPSPWMGDRDQLSVMPSLSATPTGNAKSRQIEFSHDDETAQPDYYGVSLKDGIKAEMTPADHGVVMRYTFPSSNATSSLVLDSTDDNGGFTVNSDGTVSGWVDNGSGYGRPRMFVYGTFDKNPTKTGPISGVTKATTYAAFDTSSSHTVTLRLSTSFISVDQAKKNYGFELSGNTFDSVRAAAQQAWNVKLGVMKVTGASDTKLTTLYSNLYRLNLYPNEQFENTGTADSPTYQYASPVSAKTGTDTTTATGAHVVTGKLYVNNGFWDTYRTVWPAYSLLYPKFASEIIDGFVQQYRDGGWVARWSSPGYADIMTGTSSDVAFADAYLRGVKLKDPLATFDAAVKNATVVSPSSATGRKGLDSSIFLGYTPTSTGESVSWALEGYINDYGIANMAAALAKDPDIIKDHADRIPELTEDATYFRNRALDYVNLFDSSTGFFRGKSSNGSFASGDFDPTAWGGDYTETDAWNFAFHAPQDGQGLANLYGGTDKLEQKLDAFFSTPEVAKNTGIDGGIIHEQAEARDVRMGQLGQSDQVSHHIAYMYDFTKDPSKTQAYVREIMQRLYVGDEIGQGYPGDEDNGEMSAWYILSSLGIYPLEAGSSTWAVGSPLFDSATVTNDAGQKLVVNAANNSPTNVYVQSLAINGKSHDSTAIDQSALLGADGTTTTLDFTMGATASSWGSTNPPPSLTTGDAVADPLADSTGTQYGSGVSRDGEDTKALFDNTSDTQTTFSSSKPEVTFSYNNAKQKVTQYTLTSGTATGDPSAWKLEGSNDGTTWTTLDTRTGQKFANRQQTIPFSVASPGSFQQYRLEVTDSTTQTPSIAEVELLADPKAGDAGALSFTPATGQTATSGTTASLSLGSLSGGATGGSYTATVDWGDGSAASAATITAQGFGNSAVTASHTYAKPGTYRVMVTASDGTTQTVGTTTIDVSYVASDSLVGAFDRTCIGDDGVGANCDGKNYSYSRQGASAAGIEPGKSIAVPSTSLKFTLPKVAAGAPDNAIGAGQTIRTTLPADATQLSFIGSGTQGNQSPATPATITFTDGSTATTPIQFGDWTLGGHADGAPQYGNITVASTGYRLNGGAKDGAVPFFFSTAPYTIPTGKTVASITLPDQSSTSETSAGRIHVFAIASDGTPNAALTTKAGDAITGVAGTSGTDTLGTVTGGDPLADGSYTARVQWGDASETEDATVTVSKGVGTISGKHTYKAAGDYTVSVTAVDRDSSSAFTLAAHVTAPVVYTPTLTLDDKSPVHAGDTVAFHGAGFKPGESVDVTLNTSPQVTATATADGKGALAASVTVPKTADVGNYAITAVGDDSAAPASVTVQVDAKTTPPTYAPSVVLSRTSAGVGEIVGVQGQGFAPGEKVQMTLHSTPIALGTATANSEGVISGRFTVPTGATVGAHTVTFTGVTSNASTSDPFTVTAPGASSGSGGQTGGGTTAGSTGSTGSSAGHGAGTAGRGHSGWLAFTGSPESVWTLALVGLAAIVLGGLAILRARRRHGRE